MNVRSTENFEKPAEFGAGTVWVDRTGPRELTGHTQGGFTVPIGAGEGRVSPGELLKLALIGCAGMSLDHAASRRLGEDFPLRIFAHGVSDEPENRYLTVNEQIQLDIDSLSSEERDKLAATLERVITAACTIQRTVTQGATVHHTLIDSTGTAGDNA